MGAVSTVFAAHPLPAAPLKGEVPFSDFCVIQAPYASFTSPLLGEAGRGVAPRTEFSR